MNIDRSFLIVPEVYYHLGLSNIVKETNWKINTFSAGLSIIYTPKYKEKVIYEKHLKEEIIDTITVEAKEIKENKIMTGRQDITNKTNKTEDTVYFVETIKRTDTLFIQPKLIAKLKYKEPEITLSINYSKTSYPVLPVVFYEKMSDKTDDYYIKLEDKNSFSIESLEKNPLVFHKDILNIIGKRLEQFPESTIQLKGYVDFDREHRDCNLALKRAEGIKDYLVNIWKIDDRRIEIKNSSDNCFPENVPSDKTDSAFAENRRVEILTSNPEILTSISCKEPVDTTVSFSDIINYDWSESTLIGLDNWELEVIQSGKLKYHDGDPVGSYKLINQKLDSSSVSDELKGNPMEAALIINDINGREATDKKKINFNKIIKENDNHIVFSILFSLADDRLSNKVKSEMKNFVEKLDSAKVIITGYSDIIGGEKKNRMLSSNRAKNSAELIRSINPKLDIISIKSYSYDKFPPGIYSYGLPSERYLARTVLIEIIK
ncbi:MAG: OmpA family protein [Ignavibacteriae bacterium]|nr:OmpA family protein [Ignavibacteriota bacterium]